MLVRGGATAVHPLRSALERRCHEPSTQDPRYGCWAAAGARGGAPDPDGGREVEILATSLGRRLAELAENVRASTWTMVHGNPAEIILATIRIDQQARIVRRHRRHAERDAAKYFVSASAPIS